MTTGDPAVLSDGTDVPGIAKYFRAKIESCGIRMNWKKGGDSFTPENTIQGDNVSIYTGGLYWQRFCLDSSVSKQVDTNTCF